MRHKLIILLAGIAGLAGLVLAPAAGGAAAKDKGGSAPVQATGGSQTSDLISPATLTADTSSDGPSTNAATANAKPKPPKRCDQGGDCVSQPGNGEHAKECNNIGRKYNRDLAKRNSPRDQPPGSKRWQHDDKRTRHDYQELTKHGCRTPNYGDMYQNE